MGLFILRCAFLAIITGLGVFFANSGMALNYSIWEARGIFLGTLSLAVVVIALDFASRKKINVRMVSAIYFGLIVGLFLAYVAGLALSPFPMRPSTYHIVQTLLSITFCYWCISMLIQTQDNFRFIIPYVEFVKEVKGRRPYILDTSAIIDGRLADIVDAVYIDDQLIMPQFVLAELHAIADSTDRQRRSRGRNGLDVLNRLRNNPQTEFIIFDQELSEWAGLSVDMKLVALAKHLNGKLITTDFNLNKVAKLHDVPVLNLNNLVNAMKPKFLPGDRAKVRIVRSGESPGQGIGYLDDGTMVVVEKGRDYMDQDVHISITSMLQTSAGHMVFGRIES